MSGPIGDGVPAGLSDLSDVVRPTLGAVSPGMFDGEDVDVGEDAPDGAGLTPGEVADITAQATSSGQDLGQVN